MAAYHDTEESATLLTPENFASLEKPRYCDFDLLGFEVEDEVEDLEGYEPGGFCPVDISLRDQPKFINDRFQVIYKLGFGGFGIVWLCYDTISKEWRALKIHKASRSAKNQNTESRGDLFVSQRLERDSVTTEDALDNGVALPLETFWIESPNGRHLCLVLPVLGPKLSDLMEQMPGDDPTRINHIGYQVVKGMDFLHRHGICHGDFRPQNVLLKLKHGCFDDLNVEEMRQLMARPGMVDIELEAGGRSPHAPEYAVTCIKWEKLWEYVSDDVAIVDFGESYETTNPTPPDLGIPIRYAAPEVVLGGDKGIGTDLWALGCTLMDLRCRGLPSTLPYTVDMVATMEGWMGPCPPPFRLPALRGLYESDLRDWEQQGEVYEWPKPEPPDSAEAGEPQPSTNVTKLGEKGLHIGNSNGSEDPIKAELSRELTGGFVDGELTRFRLTEEEITVFGDLLHEIFQWDPQQRWTTARIMGHEWFATQHDGLKPATDPCLGMHRDVDSRPTTAVKASEVTATEPGLQVSTDVASLPKPLTQQAQSRKSWLCLCLQTIAIVSYLFGVFATLVFFLAHLIARQPEFPGRRGHVASGESSVAPLAVLNTPVVVVHVLQ
ncbi:CMGC kinase [Apiospora saccharicola]|uniref:EKC/KEOPS complex subunit BUD32 n=1 Tax=Apiospora saccharicola TaxID=335842 RepID=A0ABR1UGH6_9PEZI